MKTMRKRYQIIDMLQLIVHLRNYTKNLRIDLRFCTFEAK
jgi:hypothetical protein